MKYKGLLDDLLAIINQTKTIAMLNPNSVDAVIYKKCYHAYSLIKKTGSVDRINIKGISRQFADYYGYDVPLLIQISKVEEFINELQTSDYSNST